MTDINLKTLTPDTSLPTTGFLFGADSQASTNPSVYSTQTVATTLLGSTSLTGDTVATSLPVLDLAQTWNSSGTTFTGVRFNAAGSSSTNSAAASLLMDLQVGGTSTFGFDKSGYMRVLPTFGVKTAGGNWAGITASTLAISTSQSASYLIGLDLTQLYLLSRGTIGWNNSSTNCFATSDLILTRKAAANLQLGAADAAAPVAQTLSVQSVVAGTSNTAGQNFTITGSQGTGTGAGGSIIFQVAPANTGGGAGIQNVLSPALTINDSKDVTFAADLFTLNQTSGYFRDLNTTYPKYQNTSSNCIIVLGKAANNQSGLFVTSNGTEAIGWLSGNYNNSPDLTLFRDNAGILAQKNGANAQEFRVYENTTGPIYKAILGNRQLIKISGASFDNGAGAQMGTLTNSPAVGNPTKWIPIDDNGTTRYIPAW